MSTTLYKLSWLLAASLSWRAKTMPRTAMGAGLRTGKPAAAGEQIPEEHGAEHTGC